jgi:hypothetical protein
MPRERLILKRASASRPSGEWNEDDFDVLADGAVVGQRSQAPHRLQAAPETWRLSRYDITEPMPAKPRLTRRRTYQRIRNEIQSLEAKVKTTKFKQRLNSKLFAYHVS